MKEQLIMELAWLEETINRVASQVALIEKMIEERESKLQPIFEAVEQLRKQIDSFRSELELEEKVKEQETPSPPFVPPEPPVSHAPTPKPPRKRKERDETKED